MIRQVGVACPPIPVSDHLSDLSQSSIFCDNEFRPKKDFFKIWQLFGGAKRCKDPSILGYGIQFLVPDGKKDVMQFCGKENRIMARKYSLPVLEDNLRRYDFEPHFQAQLTGIRNSYRRWNMGTTLQLFF
jgi:hypothetical protein